MFRITRSLLLFIFATGIWLHGQYELPREIFQRTILVRSGNEQGTALKFDQGGRIYLVTTRHFANHLPPVNATIQVWSNQTWTKLPTLRTLFPADHKVDLAILETGELISKPYAVVKSAEVLATQQQVWVMGSFGIPSRLNGIATLPRSSQPYFPEMPFVTIGTITTIDPTLPDSFRIHSQRSYNSLLLASGPIVYWSPAHRDYEILGIIKRNERDAQKVPMNHEENREAVKSGIVEGYSIDIVVDTINKNLRPAIE